MNSNDSWSDERVSSKLEFIFFLYILTDGLHFIYRSENSKLEPGTLVGSGTPRPKTISARDSSAQIDVLLGLLGPGLLGPVIKVLFCAIQWKTNVYLVCFYFKIRFSTLGKSNVKKEIIFS